MTSKDPLQALRDSGLTGEELARRIKRNAEAALSAPDRPETEAAVDELVRWLREQLDEDERVALAAIAEHDGEASWPIEPKEQGDYGPRLLWLTVMDSTSPETIPPAMAEHITRWDPARVLAEVEAKRKILDEAIWLMSHDREFQFLEYLAQPYARRPGYRNEWRAV